MVYVVQVVLSGNSGIPKIFLDRAAAEAAFVACVKEYWGESYPAFCERNNVDGDRFDSAQAFLKTHDYICQVKVNYWSIMPEQTTCACGEMHPEARCGAKPHDVGVSGTVAPPSVAMTPVPPKEHAVQDSPEWKKYVDSLKIICGGSRGEFPIFSRQDWRLEVYSNVTPLEYWEWVAEKVDACIRKAGQAGYSLVEAPGEPGHYTFRAPDGTVSEGSFDTQEEAWCLAALHANHQP